MTKTALILTALSVGLSASSASAQYELIYDAETGELRIDTLGGPLYAYILQGPGDLLEEDGFIQEAHTILPEPSDTSLYATTSTDDELSESSFDGWTGLPQTSLGFVLDPGLSPAQLNSQLETAVYVDQFGSLGDPSALLDFNIVYIPEPTSLVIMGLGAAMIVRRRRS